MQVNFYTPIYCTTRFLLTWSKVTNGYRNTDLTDYDGDIPAFIPEKYFLNVNFEAL